MQYFYNQKKDYGYYDQPTHPTGQTMATAALVLGIAALVSVWTLYLPLILGGLGVIFAYLSKGFEKKLSGNAKAGLSFSIGGVFISLAVIAAILVYFLSNPAILLDYGRQLDRMVLQTYGQTSAMMMGFSYEEMMQNLLDLF